MDPKSSATPPGNPEDAPQGDVPVNTFTPEGNRLVEYPRVGEAKSAKRKPTFYLVTLLWSGWALAELSYIGPPQRSGALGWAFWTFMAARIVLSAVLLLDPARALKAVKGHCWLGIGTIATFLPFLCVAAFGALFATLVGVQIVLGLVVDSCVSGLVLFELRAQNPATDR